MVKKKNNQHKKKQEIMLAKDKNQAFLGLGLFGFCALKISHTLFTNIAEAELSGQIFMSLGIIILIGAFLAAVVIMAKPYIGQMKSAHRQNSAKTVRSSDVKVSDKKRLNLDGLKKSFEGKKLQDYKYPILALGVLFVLLIAKTAHMGYVYYNENHSKAPVTVEVPPVDKMGMPEANVETDVLISSSSSKKVLVPVEGKDAIDPFVPFQGDSSMLPAFDLMAPPDTLAEDSEAQKVMSTTVSGILFDNYSPSAIINISDTDYLVKKGDVVNNYRVLSISRNQVVVQLGKNIYKAGVGEILAKGEVNINNVSNLNRKFGGSPEVQINVRRQTY